MGGASHRVLHVNHRLAVLRWLSFGASRQVLCPVHGRRAVQLRPAGRLLLDHDGRNGLTLYWHLPSCSAASSTVTLVVVMYCETKTQLEKYHN